MMDGDNGKFRFLHGYEVLEIFKTRFAFTVDDTVGFGIDFNKKEFFMSLNGKTAGKF